MVRTVSRKFLLILAVWLGTVVSPLEARALRFEAPEHLAVGEAAVCTVWSPFASTESMVLVWEEFRVPLIFWGQEDGSFRAEALISASLDQEVGRRPIVISSDRREIARSEVSIRSREFEEQRLALPKAMVDPKPESLERHWAEQKEIKAILGSVTAARYWDLPLAWPVPGSISSSFGLRRVLNGQPRSPHKGIDLRGAEGTPVAACADGVVVLTGDHYFSGRSVYLDHGLGVISLYAHLSDISVRSGQVVRKGEVVGSVGKTGRATGPHLHFGLSVLGRSVDPVPLLKGRD